MGLVYGIARGGRGERDHASGQALGHAQYVRFDTGLFAGKDGPGTAPAGHHLVGDEQHVMLAADLRHFCQQGGTVHPHPAGTENQGFDDQCRRRIVPVCAEVLQLVKRVLLGPGRWKT